MRQNIERCVMLTRSVSDLGRLVTITPVTTAATSSASKELLSECRGHQGKECEGLHVYGYIRQEGRQTVQ